MYGLWLYAEGQRFCQLSPAREPREALRNSAGALAAVLGVLGILGPVLGSVLALGATGSSVGIRGSGAWSSSSPNSAAEHGTTEAPITTDEKACRTVIVSALKRPEQDTAKCVFSELHSRECLH